MSIKNEIVSKKFKGQNSIGFQNVPKKLPLTF